MLVVGCCVVGMGACDCSCYATSCCCCWVLVCVCVTLTYVCFFVVALGLVCCSCGMVMSGFSLVPRRHEGVARLGGGICGSQVALCFLAPLGALALRLVCFLVGVFLVVSSCFRAQLGRESSRLPCAIFRYSF